MPFASKHATERIHQLGERIARNLGVPPSQVRYVYAYVHDGRQWTIQYMWEQRCGNSWIEIDDRIWNDLHGTPAN